MQNQPLVKPVICYKRDYRIIRPGGHTDAESSQRWQHLFWRAAQQKRRQFIMSR
jgi:hypothetical protein